MQWRALASRLNPHIVSARAGQSLPVSLLRREYGCLMDTSICALPRAGANRSRSRTHVLAVSFVGMPTIRSLSSNNARVSVRASKSKYRSVGPGAVSVERVVIHGELMPLRIILA